MGNSPIVQPRPLIAGSVDIKRFYNANTWIEGKAEDQLKHVAGFPTVSAISAFPDLHAGKYGPVGCALLSDRIYPQLIGNDIGCGMSLFQLDAPTRKFKPEKAAEKLRKFFETEMESHDDIITQPFASSLGTIGGGNHFCEVQAIDQVIDTDLSPDKSVLYLLVHSGSRGFGTEVFSEFAESSGLEPGSENAKRYLDLQGQAVTWASLNRLCIARKAARLLRTDCQLISDAPHNLLEETCEGFLHRKGAAKADMNLVPIAGTRDSLSWLVKPIGDGVSNLQSLAHGAGRRYDRASMHGRIKKDRSVLDKLARTSFGGHVICEDKQLMIEEAPKAYKSVKAVLSDLQDFGLVQPVASFKPLLTLKKVKRTGGRRS